MADPLTDDEFDNLLRTEMDAFRLIIRGWAAVEADLNAFTVEAFEFPWEGNFGRIYVKHRIAIAAALGIIPSSVAPAITKLADLRNEFAHGTHPDLTVERARQLREAFDPWVADEARTALEKLAPLYSVVYILNVTRSLIRYGADATRKARERRLRDEALRKVLAARIAELRPPEAG